MVPTSLSILPPQLTVQAHLGANELRHERHHGVRGAAAQREHRAAAALIVIMTKPILPPQLTVSSAPGRE
jgi:hypothetical protein